MICIEGGVWVDEEGAVVAGGVSDVRVATRGIHRHLGADVLIFPICVMLGLRLDELGLVAA